MKRLSTDEIRERYLRFFESKGHKVVASDSLVPKADPTLLFTGAGMNQFKEQFLGKNVAYKRATTSQKCLRTDDLDKVGKTPCHHTFFEMLGNFSFGDYFKAEAIEWAWEFMTKVLEVPDQKLWVSVYKDDDEAYRIWAEKIKIPENKIIKLGDKENFWPSEAPTKGPNGPCGPCSEIFYDQGKEYGCGKPGCDPSCDCGRFVEVWNLVFTQLDRVGPGKLLPLPNKNIDTGMGLERIASVLQGVYTNFEIDIFEPIIDEITKQVGVKYLPRRQAGKADKKTNSAINAIADHIRAVTFAICDGVMPSNEWRGYVVRKLIRKASWHARTFGKSEAFLYKVVPLVTKVMAKAYPELAQRRENMSHIVLSEEQRFAQTIEGGQAILDDIFAALEKESKKVIPGDVIFKLYDTYGFPVELTAQIAGERGIELDLQGFESLMAQQKERAKEKSAILSGAVFAPAAKKLVEGQTQFVGYETIECGAKVVGIIKNDESVKTLSEKEKGIVVLDKTPFYAESGGQVGDKGVLERAGAKAIVADTKYIGDAIGHHVEIQNGDLRVGDEVEAKVDAARRQDVMRNHTATHLLQYALRAVLGEHLHQAGSLVEPERLRFDFTHFAALDERTLERVEALVNERILKNENVVVAQMPAQEAIKSGATALFGEKYGDTVRVVTAGDSRELCGGTHVEATGRIGLFKIISEGSVQSGVRRIEAQTGIWAYKKIRDDEESLREIAELLKCAPDRAAEHLEKLIQRAKYLEREIKKLASKRIEESLDELAAKAKDVNGVGVVVERLDGASEDLLRRNIDLLRKKVKSGIFVLGSKLEDRAVFVCGVTDDQVKGGVHAGKMLGQIARIAGGTGGGKPQLAQAGAKDAARLDEALAGALDIIIKEIKRL